MLDWLASLDLDRVIGIAGAAGVGLAAIGAVVKGFRSGRPTSAAVASAVQAASCRAVDLGPTFTRIREDLAEIRSEGHEERRDLREEFDALREQVQKMHVLLAKIDGLVTPR